MDFIGYILKTKEVKEILIEIENGIKSGSLKTSLIFTKLHCDIPELQKVNLEEQTLEFLDNGNKRVFRFSGGVCVPI